MRALAHGNGQVHKLALQFAPRSRCQRQFRADSLAQPIAVPIQPPHNRFFAGQFAYLILVFQCPVRECKLYGIVRFPVGLQRCVGGSGKGVTAQPAFQRKIILPQTVIHLKAGAQRIAVAHKKAVFLKIHRRPDDRIRYRTAQQAVFVGTESVARREVFAPVFGNGLHPLPLRAVFALHGLQPKAIGGQLQPPELFGRIQPVLVAVQGLRAVALAETVHQLVATARRYKGNGRSRVFSGDGRWRNQQIIGGFQLFKRYYFSGCSPDADGGVENLVGGPGGVSQCPVSVKVHLAKPVNRGECAAVAFIIHAAQPFVFGQEANAFPPVRVADFNRVPAVVLRVDF